MAEPPEREAGFFRTWLADYYGKPGWGVVRLLGGPVLVATGVGLRVVARGGLAEGLGALLIGYGAYYALRPLVRVWLAARQRRARGGRE